MVSTRRGDLKELQRSGNSDLGLWRGYCQPEEIDRLLGSDAVKIYKQFNFQFGENVAKDVRKELQKILESWLHLLELQRPNKELRFVLVIKAE